jgi:hypothetical protein
MSTESTTKQFTPLRCRRCQGEDGPFAETSEETPAESLCEPCARPMPLGGAQ